MIEQIFNYFTIEMLYYWINFGVLPFWMILIFFPQSSICRYFVTSIFPIFILSGAYVFILYKAYLNSYSFDNNFNLYLGINNISELFSDKIFLLMFWIHFKQYLMILWAQGPGYAGGPGLCTPMEWSSSTFYIFLFS